MGQEAEPPDAGALVAAFSLSPSSPAATPSATIRLRLDGRGWRMPSRFIATAPPDGRQFLTRSGGPLPGGSRGGGSGLALVRRLREAGSRTTLAMLRLTGEGVAFLCAHGGPCRLR